MSANRHTDLRSTQRYAHLMPTALDGVVANLRSPNVWTGLLGEATNSNAPASSALGEEVAAAG